MRPDDILLWPDGFWCFADELSSGFLRKDDYRVVALGSEEWQSITSPRGPAPGP